MLGSVYGVLVFMETAGFRMFLEFAGLAILQNP